MSKHRLFPRLPPPGAFPFFYSTGDLHGIKHLAFSRPSPTGEFTDYTARYGALQEQDKDTLRFYLEEVARHHDPTPIAPRQDLPPGEMPSLLIPPPPTPWAIERIESTAAMLRVAHLLDVPLIGLSSGQTRRARIAAALIGRPRMLLLEDPFAGLDVPSRRDVGEVLRSINAGRGAGSEPPMRMVLVLRGAGTTPGVVPDWVSHVVDVQDGQVWHGERHAYEQRQDGTSASSARNPIADLELADEPPIIDMREMTIAYGPKTVLDKVSWQVRPGSRWLLSGSNGSGKTTLLALALGHHPKGWSFPGVEGGKSGAALSLFGRPRRSIPTTQLRMGQFVGHVSPELVAGFPRTAGLSAADALASGYEGVFVRLDVNAEKVRRIRYLLGEFEDVLGACLPAGQGPTVERIARHPFRRYPPGQQSLLLFLRAVVARPRLLVLDEPSQSIDEQTWTRCIKLLEREWQEMLEEEKAGSRRKEDRQAVVCVSHWREEVPWRCDADEQGHVEGKEIRLDDGVRVM